MLEPKQLERYLYALVYQVYTSKGDRRGGEAEMDPVTGLPLNPGDLVERRKAITGERLALTFVFVPRRVASSILRRPDPENPEASMALLAHNEKEWTDQEHEWVGALEFQIQKAVAKLASEHGHFDTRPESGMGEDRAVIPHDELDLPTAWKATYKGLQHAIQLCRNDPELNVSKPLKADLGTAAWRQAPEWAKAENK